MPRQWAFVGLGGNLGDVQAHLEAALEGLQALPGTSVAAVSPLYRTRPVDATGPDYLNAVAAVRSALGPAELLRALHRLEAACDRERPYLNAPRTLDLDLLWYGDVSCHTPELTLPHPRMFSRAFVLVPLQDILGRQPEWAPSLAAAMPGSERLAALAGEQGVEKAQTPGAWPPKLG